MQKLSAASSCWIYTIHILTENLKFNDSGQFYNLAYLDKLLSCLVNITSNLGWSDERHVNVDMTKLLTGIIEELSELLTAFHHGKGSDAASSFMGLNITRNALLTMNQILYEMQSASKKNWETFWISDSECKADFSSLFSLWSCRDVMVRATTLQLLAGIATSPRGTTVIVDNMRQRGEGIWEKVLMILTDNSEASIVREQAATLLTNMSSHVNVSSSGQVTLPLCHAAFAAIKNIPSNESMLLLLQEMNFFEELNEILLCLHLECTFEIVQPDQQKSNSCSGPLSSQTYQCHQNISKTSKDSSRNTATNIHEDDSYGITTPSLVRMTALFVNNLLYLQPEQISRLLSKHLLIRNYFRCLSSPPLYPRNNKTLLLYCDIMEMSTSICSLLTRSVLINSVCRSIALNTRDCLHVLISLLNSEIYDCTIPHLVNLRNKLWCEIFQFLCALIHTEKSTDSKDISDVNVQGHMIISSLLVECGYEHVIRAVLLSAESKISGLQKSSLKFLTSLLSKQSILDTNGSPSAKNSTLTFINLFKRTSAFVDSDSENIDPSLFTQDSTNQICTQQDNFKSDILIENNQNVIRSSKDMFSTKIPKARSECYKKTSLTIGANLCKSLLRLYEAHNWETNKDNKKKTIIISAISNLLSVSDEAKKYALEDGLLPIVMLNLKNLHMELSLHSVDALRKPTDKKKLSPILKEVDIIIGMITNFMVRNDVIKRTACKADLADLTHKMWLWCNVDRNLLTNALRMLCTFTTGCDAGCQSLILTNPAAGTGPRRTPNGISLLHGIINLVTKEMEHVSRTRDITVLQLCLHLLKNVCVAVECRNVVSKSNLLQSFNRAHPILTRHQRPWETIENLILEFLLTFTFYPEGQVCVAKSFEVLELLISLTTSTKSTNKVSSLCVLRNISFYQSNRTILLSSMEFLQVLQMKLTNGTTEEKNVVVTIIWSIVANSQRSKIVLKCAGLDSCLQDLVKQCEIQGVEDKSYHVMSYVLGLLKDS